MIQRLSPAARENKRAYNRRRQAERREDPAVKKAERDYGRAERRDPTTWARHVLRNVRHRAKRLGLECSITPEDIHLPAVCPVLGIPLVIGGGIQDYSSPSLDRVDNALGYSKENVRVISMHANMLKKNGTLEEMRAVLAYMERETEQSLRFVTEMAS